MREINNGPMNTIVGTGASGIESADIDNDGKPDIAVSFHENNIVNLFLNTSKGGGANQTSFSPAVSLDYPSGAAFNLNLSDLNRDELPELIIANYQTGELVLFKNISSAGKIKFESPINIKCPVNAYNIISCDLNMDGYNELIFTGGEQIGVFINNTGNKGGDIAINNCSIYDIGSEIHDIKCADIDGDGKVDIIAGSANGISILNNTSASGSKTIDYSKALNFYNDNSIHSFDIGDLDGDFKPDIVTANWPASDFSIIKNISESGKINFDKAPNISANASAVIALADFDQDGKLDIATMANGTKLNIAEIFKNTSSGNDNFAFAAAQNFNTISNNLIINDFDGNGKDDIAGVNNIQNKISVMVNDENLQSLKFKSFEVYCGEDGEVWLNWEAPVELNNTQFIIERTTDGRKFSTMAIIDGNGSNSLENLYTFCDRSPADELAFYRLKSIDTKGISVYSALNSLMPCEEPLSDFVCVYPNPVDKLMNFHFSVTSEMEMHYELLNCNMIKQIEKTEIVTPGTRTYTLDIAQLPAGTYTLVVRFGNLPARLCKFEKLKSL